MQFILDKFTFTMERVYRSTVVLTRIFLHADLPKHMLLCGYHAVYLTSSQNKSFSSLMFFFS